MKNDPVTQRTLASITEARRAMKADIRKDCPADLSSSFDAEPLFESGRIVELICKDRGQLSRWRALKEVYDAVDTQPA
jgi:hypothetical protein